MSDKETFLTSVNVANSLSEHQALKEYSKAQHEALLRASARIKELEENVAHLKELLMSSAAQPKQAEVVKMDIPTEQAICEMQIKRLLDQSMMRELTLEETKRLDLLVKNLYLAKGQSTTILATHSRLPSDISEAQLVSIAATPAPEPKP